MRFKLLHYLRLLLALTCITVSQSYTAKAQMGTAASYPFNATNEPFSYLSSSATVIGSPYVQGGYTNLHSDDVYAHNIPIGFSFLFCGSYYTSISASSNGFISFNPAIGYHYLTNGSLASYPIYPAIMAGWDDLGGSGGTASFLTTGAAPNRVFTIEFKNWQYRLGYNNTLSFQIKLFEGGMVKICYKQEAGAFTTADCTMGIAGSATDYLVLNNASTAPTPSSTSFTTTINTRPADNQVYTFGQPPCPNIPTGGLAGNVTATKANISWNNVSAPLGYEYVVNQSSGNPLAGTNNTTGTSFTASGLTPGTLYYAHVRGKCSSISVSNWLHIPFTTTMCVEPQVSMANITHNSALALWNSLAPAITYEYILNTTGVPPASPAGAVSVNTNSASLTGLIPATNYYLYMRTRCQNNENSDWGVTQFTTMLECMAPEITLIRYSPTDIEATWNEVPTAVAYEYAITTSETPPGLGQTIYENDKRFTIPEDDKAYFLHVRTKCVSIFNTSPWATIMLREAPTTGVNNVNNNTLLITAYPNPAKDNITVNLNGLKNNSGSIMLTDITGKVLFSSPASGSIMNIDMSSVPTGIYLIKYNDANSNQVLKISKQ